MGFKKHWQEVAFNRSGFRTHSTSSWFGFIFVADPHGAAVDGPRGIAQRDQPTAVEGIPALQPRRPGPGAPAPKAGHQAGGHRQQGVAPVADDPHRCEVVRGRRKADVARVAPSRQTPRHRTKERVKRGGKIALNPVRGPPFPVFAAFFDLPVRFLCSCNNAAPPPAANRCRSRSLVCGGGKNKTKVSRSFTVASAYSPTGRPFSLSIVLVAHCVYSFACGAKLRACRNTISNTDAELPLFASQHAVLVRWSFCDRANRLSKVGFVQSNRVRTI